MTRDHDDRRWMSSPRPARWMATALAAASLILAWTSAASSNCFYNGSPHVVRVAHVDVPSKSIRAEHVLRARQAICLGDLTQSMVALYSDIIARNPRDYASLNRTAIGQLGKLYANQLSPNYFHVIPRDWVFAVFNSSPWSVIELRPGANHWFQINQRIAPPRGQVPLMKVFDAQLRPQGILNLWIIEARSSSAPAGTAPSAPSSPTVTVACPRETIDRAKSAYTWVRFNLPQGRPGDVINIPGGARNKYVFPTCHRVAWNDHVYRCSDTGGWTRVRGDATADILCHGGLPNSPYIQTGEN
ncbi:MAG: hypothetical protein GC150_01575 [Rhizobiales bacterium]|nr:hypothetical protein [Hyphomicrobiales bacterium]